MPLNLVNLALSKKRLVLRLVLLLLRQQQEAAVARKSMLHRTIEQILDSALDIATASP